MDDVATEDNSLRRVGLSEGVQSMVGGAVLLVVLTLLFQEWAAAAALAGGALGWLSGYAGLRWTRRRWWCGQWDGLSFAFVWGYAVVLALAVRRFLF